MGLYLCVFDENIYGVEVGHYSGFRVALTKGGEPIGFATTFEEFLDQLVPAGEFEGEE